MLCFLAEAVSIEWNENKNNVSRGDWVGAMNDGQERKVMVQENKVNGGARTKKSGPWKRRAHWKVACHMKRSMDYTCVTIEWCMRKEWWPGWKVAKRDRLSRLSGQLKNNSCEVQWDGHHAAGKHIRCAVTHGALLSFFLCPLLLLLAVVVVVVLLFGFCWTVIESMYLSACVHLSCQ